MAAVGEAAMSDEARNVEILKTAYRRWSDTLGGSVGETNLSPARDWLEFRGVGGHGGGDEGLTRAFVGAIQGDRGSVLTSAREAVTSHLMAFAAEEARVTGETVDMERYRRSVSQKVSRII